MQTEYYDYRDGDVACEAYVAHPDTAGAARNPAVIIAHAWGGQSEFERGKAEKIAALGYIGFAIDLYGKGVRGGTMEQNAALMQPFIDDRALLRRRILAAHSAVRSHPRVDFKRVAAIGFCFGGLCVLDLARSVPPDLRGVASLHGLLHPPRLEKQPPIAASVLILHGFDDPMAPPDQLLAIGRELTDANADWQLHAYGRTSHAFTNPQAKSPEHGLIYNELADRRSWRELTEFLAEAFA
jgi:dienelactone hydrolase